MQLHVFRKTISKEVCYFYFFHAISRIVVFQIVPKYLTSETKCNLTAVDFAVAMAL